MYSFDGQFKSKPRINLAGSSRARDRDHLLREAQAERIKRELERKQQQAATRIQAAYRSHLARQRVRQGLRGQFAALMSAAGASTPVAPFDVLPALVRCFVMHFDERLEADLGQLANLSKFILSKWKSRSELSDFQISSSSQCYT